MAKITSSGPRRMPSAKVVREWWAPWLVGLGKFDSIHEVMEAEYCFACGMKSELVRAHITARAIGGSDEAGNLHMLCRYCHMGSELLDGAPYWDWLVWQHGMRLAILAPLDLPSVRECMERTEHGAQMVEGLEELVRSFDTLPAR